MLTVKEVANPAIPIHDEEEADEIPDVETDNGGPSNHVEALDDAQNEGNTISVRTRDKFHPLRLY